MFLALIALALLAFDAFIGSGALSNHPTVLVNLNANLSTEISSRTLETRSVSDSLSLVHARRCGDYAVHISRLGINYFDSSRLLEYGVSGTARTMILFPNIVVRFSAYGRAIELQAINICSHTACPLAIDQDFVVRGSLVMDQDAASSIPSLAWSAPDLDAFVTVTVVNAGTSPLQELTCVVGELSNGKTVRQKSVAIITAAISLAVIALASLRQLTRRPETPHLTGDAGFVVDAATLSTITQPASTRGFPPEPIETDDHPMYRRPGSRTYEPLSIASDPSHFPLHPIMEASSITSDQTGPSMSGFSSHANYHNSQLQDLHMLPYNNVAPTTTHVQPTSAHGHTGFESYYGSLAVGGVDRTTPYPQRPAGAAIAQQPVHPDNPFFPLPNPHDPSDRNFEGYANPLASYLPDNSAIGTKDSSDTYEHEAPAGRLDPIALFLHFQSISSMGLLSIRYPPIYLAFTANFAWANLLLPVGIFGVVVSGMRRCYLPEESSLTADGIPPVSDRGYLGIQAYAHLVRLQQQELFPIVFMVFLIACAALLALVVVPSVLHLISITVRRERRQVWAARADRWWEIMSSNVLRVMILSLGPLATFSFNRWTQACTAVLVYPVSALALLLVIVTLSAVSFVTVRAFQRHGTTMLFGPESLYARRWGPIYSAFRADRLLFVAMYPIASLVRSAITSFGQHHGLEQVCAIIAVDVIICVVLVAFRPYYSPGCNRVYYLLEFTRATSDVLMLIFVERLRFSGWVREISGLIIMVLNTLAALVLLLLIITKLGWGILWHRRNNGVVVR